MKDNSPASYDSLSDKVLTNTTLAMMLLNQQAIQGKWAHVNSCDQACRRKAYCYTRSQTPDDALKCIGEKEDFFSIMFNQLSNPWIVKKKNN